MTDGRESLLLDDCTEIEMIGLGQNKRVIFRSTDKNVDLFDKFVTFNPFEDAEYWLLVRVPGDDENFWNETDLAKVEYFLNEDFGFDRYDVHCQLAFGEDFPRSVPASWRFRIFEREDDD